jgi:broad specificity phosphatase PhoE
MGASQSIEEDEEEEEEEDDEAEQGVRQEIRRGIDDDNSLVKKLLEQEPEMLPCHASASPLSPQLSSFGTPRLGPSIKVWDPYNVLAPPPPIQFPRNFSSDSIDTVVTDVFFICHGECHMNLRPDLIAGRCPEAALTPNGKRQARALSVFLNSQGVRFSSVYSSPLDRARATAISVCQEMKISEEEIQSTEGVIEMSHGVWEGCHRSEIYTPEIQALIDRHQPDFSAPSGESLRQVEFRMLQFLTTTVTSLPVKLHSDFSPPEPVRYANNNNSIPTTTITISSINDRDSLHKHRPIATKKKSGKSRLQFVTTTGDHEADDEMSPRESNHQLGSGSGIGSIHHVRNTSFSPPVFSAVAVFTHSVPIKCLLTGILGCSPAVSNKICIDDSSVTVLQHSFKSGWQIKRINDTAHLRLL